MESFDTQAMIAEVAARHGVLLKPDDAAFALITMNEIVMERAVKLALDSVESRVKVFEKSLVNLERLAGKALAQEIKDASASERANLWELVKVTGTVAEKNKEIRGQLNVVIIVLVFVVGWAVGWIVLLTAQRFLGWRW